VDPPARQTGNDTFTWPQCDGLKWTQSTTLGELDWGPRATEHEPYPPRYDRQPNPLLHIGFELQMRRSPLPSGRSVGKSYGMLEEGAGLLLDR
jgi:hypothetical protein